LINVNLISEQERLRRIGETAGRIAFFVAVAVFILTMGAITLQQTRLRALRSGTSATQSQITRLEGRKAEIDLLQGQIDSKRPLVDLLRGARDSEEKWCDALTDIAGSTPLNVAITSLRSSDSLQPKVKEQGATAAASSKPVRYEGFTISGEAITGDLVSQFITNLQNTASFGDVYVESVRRRKGANNVEIFEFDVQALLAKEKPAP
jgi:Tfp pilus assembly protein PilN